jgi:type I restriction-modification system DNA methylase subunit
MNKEILMELSLFQDENTLAFTKVRKDKLASAIKLYNMTCSYFIATDPNAFRKLKTFNEDFAYLCEDLFTQIEISTLKKDQKNLISDAYYSGDFFQDPKKDYYEILIEYLKKGNANQKALGAFYTPQDVVETLTSTIIRKNNYKTSDLNKLKVLDPTMGGCDWLTCWFEQVLKKNLNNRKSIDADFKEQVFSHTIHGVDIDPVAVLCSRLIFWHYFDYKSSTKKTLKKNLVLGNTLDIFTNSQKKVPGFDIIIGNPPYVVQNLKSLNCQTNDSSNLFAAITEASTELLSDGGTICFVVPLNITCAKSFSSLREYMDEKYQEITFSTYGIRPQKMFDGVDQRITVFFAKKKTLKNKSQAL